MRGGYRRVNASFLHADETNAQSEHRNSVIDLLAHAVHMVSESGSSVGSLVMFPPPGVGPLVQSGKATTRFVIRRTRSYPRAS